MSNVTLNPGTGGQAVATDLISSEHYQYVKLTDGSTGSINAAKVDSGGRLAVEQPDTVITGSYAVTGDSVTSAQFDAYSTATVRLVNGSGSTLAFEASLDNTNWFGVIARDIAVGGSLQGTTTLQGVFTCNISGYSFFRVRCANFLGATSATIVLSNTVSSIGLNGSLPAGTNSIGSVVVTGNPTPINPGDTMGNAIPTHAKIALTSQFNGTQWERVRGNCNIAVDASAAKTATVAGTTAVNYNHKGAYIVVAVTAVTGTTPSLTAQLQFSIDGTNFFNVGAASEALTANGSIVWAVNPEVIAADMPVNNFPNLIVVSTQLPRIWRIFYTISGTTPSFTLSSTASYLV